MKSKILMLLLAFALVGTFAFAGGDKEAPAPQMEQKAAPAAPKPVKITWSAVSVPEDAHTKAMMVFKLELERLGEGNIDVELYHSGQLFTQEAAQAAIKRGTLDMVYTGPNWVADLPAQVVDVCHALRFQELRTHEQILQQRGSPTAVRRGGREDSACGLWVLFTWEPGSSTCATLAGKFARPPDMKGVKLRMPGSATWQYMGKLLGASPTPLSFTEVYMGLKTGTVDGQDNPLPTDKNAKFYEVTKYIIMTNHYVNPVMPTMNEKKWQSLGPDLQAKVMQAIEMARQTCDESEPEAGS